MSGPQAPAPRAPKVVVVGAARTPLRDFYHRFLWMRWSAAVAWIFCAVLAINFVFALAYELVGGVEGMSPTFRDAFFFSVQTLATIGYGAMHPVSLGVHVIVTIEAIVGRLVTALVTQQELEFTISLLGLDETSLQPVYASHTYLDREVRWGMRPADMLSETSEGDLVIDVRHFDALVATAPAPDFPYNAGQRVLEQTRHAG